MLQAYEGYLEKGHFTHRAADRHTRPLPCHCYCFRGADARKNNTWAELDKIVADMDEKPRLEDFPRCQFGREFVYLC